MIDTTIRLREFPGLPPEGVATAVFMLSRIEEPRFRLRRERERELQAR
ncbi:hypothetical protein [Variovorax sp. LT1R16]